VMKERGEEIDLVLLDLGMPGLGGKACLLELIADHPLTPVVMLTGRAQPQDLEELIGLGAREAISKPVPVASLLSTLGTVLRERAAAEH
jgi:DNA-binding response OmpR family regulator